VLKTIINPCAGLSIEVFLKKNLNIEVSGILLSSNLIKIQISNVCYSKDIKTRKK
jgi:hypothetical protein